MKTKYAVVTAYGTFKRTTERTYTHFVIARGFNPETITARYSRELPYAQSQVVKYEAAATFAAEHGGAKVTIEDGCSIASRDWLRANGRPAGTLRVTDPTNKYDIGFTADEWLGWAAQERETIATNATRRDAELAANEAREYSDLGWCGRIDLAVKLANQSRNNGYRDVKIIVVATGYEL